jgi:septal ring factor EnvC (AmiA/AmiB activator)
MKPLDVKAAAQLFKVARSTLYTKMDKGELSRRQDKKLDFAELVRVFGEPGDRQTRQEKTLEVSELAQTFKETPEVLTRHAEREAELLARVAELEANLQATRQNLEKAEERENWFREQFGKMTDVIKLLEAPKIPEPAEKKSFWARLWG